MTSKRRSDPITPASIPGEQMDTEIPPDQIPESEDELLESEAERLARERPKADMPRGR